MQFPDRFILYKLVPKPDSPKADKVPCNAAGEPINPHDPSQWMTHADASSRVTSAVSGVGFVLNGDGWWCIDLDNCRDMTTGGWTDAATLIYQSFPGCLAEVSVSGTGLHIYGRCDPSRLADRRNKWDGWCEWYHTGRFIALGGGGLSPIGDAWVERDWTDQLLKLLPERVGAGDPLPEGTDPAYTGPADDERLIEMMLASSSTASKFGAGATFADLWEARAPVLSRAYPAYDGAGGFDHSSADAALMSHLAFWTGKDMARMDRLFRRSALMRDKYDKREDYRRDTVQGAVRMCKRVYDRLRRENANVIASDDSESRFYSAASLDGKSVPKRQWLVDGLVPSKTVTLLSGDGGTGKSLLALQLAVAAATGTPWLGKPVQSGGVIFTSAEDDEAELHRRLADIIRAQDLSYGACERLTLRSLAGRDALLAIEGQYKLIESDLFKQLDNRALQDAPVCIVIDTLADVFPANENDRTKARQFIGILRKLAIQHNCAVILLAHPSLTGLNTRSGTSGSTGWNNSVRSRLYLERDMSDGYEADSRRRVLSVKKSNYGETGSTIPMIWHAGVFAIDSAVGSDKRNTEAERVFLKLLRIFTGQGRNLNPNSGSNYAPKLMSEHPECEGVAKKALRQAMESLLSSGKICFKEEGPPSKRSKYLVENASFRELPLFGDGTGTSTSPTIPPAPPLPVGCLHLP
jgi:RecA-family ATPase